jgi:heat shock protein HslJ
MNKIILLFIIFATVILSWQCAQKGNSSAKDTDANSAKTGDINGLWVLQDMKNSEISAKTGTFIQLSDSGYHLFAGCNQINGEIQITGNSITIKPGISTLMGCDDAGYEQNFSAILFAVNTFQATSKQLTLHTDKGSILTFEKQTPLEHLAGHNFQVEGLTINNGVVSSIDAPLQTLYFGQDGSLSGNAGCNNYNAQYKIEGNQLQISQVGSTRMACSDEKTSQYESAFFSHLQKSPLSIEDTPNQVTLRESNGSTVMVLKEIVKK